MSRSSMRNRKKIRKMKQEAREREQRMDPETAFDIADSMGLPDGAYWAVMEEMTGMEPADLVTRDDD